MLDVTAMAPTLVDARERAYAAVERISFPGARWRTDIALAASSGAPVG